MAGTVTMRFSAEDAKLVQSVLKTRDKLDQLERKAQSLEQTTKRGNRSATSGANDWTQSIVGVAASYMSLQTIQRGVLKTLEEINAENARAAEFAKASTSRSAEGRLASLVDPLASAAQQQSAIDRLQARRRTIQRTAGVDSQTASDITFQLESLRSFKDTDTDWVSRLTPMLPEPAAFLEGVEKTISSFGTAETGDAKRVAGKLFVAAQQSILDPSQLAPQMATFAKMAKDVGTTDEEAMAAMAALPSTTRSPEQAATQVKAFVKALGEIKGPGVSDDLRARVSSSGLVGAAEALQAAGIDPRAFSGNVRAQQGYMAILESAGQIREVEQRVKRADSASTVTRQIAAFERDPELAAAHRARQAEQRRAIAEEDAYARSELAAQRTINERMAASAGKTSRVQRVAESSIMEGAKYLGADADQVDQLGRNTAAGYGIVRGIFGGNPYDPGTVEYRDYQRRMADEAYRAQQAEIKELNPTPEPSLIQRPRQRTAWEAAKATAFPAGQLGVQTFGNAPEYAKLLDKIADNTAVQPIVRPRNTHVE